MTARKILLWGLPVLIFASLFTGMTIEKTYQARRRAGWITYLEPANSSSTLGSESCSGRGSIL
jgi:hypothetical protein